MTLRIESVSDEHGTTIRLIGRMQAQHVEELKAQIGASGARVVLDLEELSLVDIDAVRFLGTCQAGGISIIHCPLYINDWIAKERGQDT
jgi:anti-anti-sigma regulatory factor